MLFALAKFVGELARKFGLTGRELTPDRAYDQGE
jgi:hypothetical protein